MVTLRNLVTNSFVFLRLLLKLVFLGQFPSTVSFQYVVYNEFGIKTFKHFCGGSLIEISPQFKWILSAGHCFTNV